MSELEDQDFDVLPVESFKEDILQHLRSKAHQVLICVGETGSGKTTKIPQIIVDAGLLNDDSNSKDSGRQHIAVTQPRRVGAMTVSQRVASERRGCVGDEVGYRVRFDDRTGPNTRIHFMTDGILVRECMQDPQLRRYKVVMLDEAHERSIHTDILFGLLKNACSMRPDLMVLITSATLDTDKFVEYFDGAPALHIPGRVFPVDLYHSKLAISMTASGPATNAYVQAAAETALQIHDNHDPSSGHILVFLTGQDEIDRCCRLLAEGVSSEDNERDQSQRGPRSRADGRPIGDLLIIPLHGSLSAEQQRAAFLKAPQGVRKCIVCTNIAETSVTVPHVRYVVDAGYVKQKAYDPDRHLESLVVVPVSQVAAQQRAGRAGRTGPGECYRLYSSESYNNMFPASVPEIRRCGMAGTVLTLKALGINDVIGFDFIDPPSVSQMEEALSQLYLLGALDGEGSNIGAITAIGRDMSRLPLDPMLGRMMVEATLPDNDCAFEVACIAAVISASSEEIFMRPSRQQRRGGRHDQGSHKRPYAEMVDEEDEDAQVAHAKLRHAMGDHFTFIKLLCAFERANSSQTSSNSVSGFQWCRQNFVRFRTLRTAINIRDQLLRDMRDVDIRTSTYRLEDSYDVEAAVSRCLVAGMFMNAARVSASEDMYRTIPMYSDFDRTPIGAVPPLEDVKLVHLHPSSVLAKESIAAVRAFNKKPKTKNNPDVAQSLEHVVYQDILFSSKLYVRHVSAVTPWTLHRRRDNLPYVSPKALCGLVDTTPFDSNAPGKRSDVVNFSKNSCGPEKSEVTSASVSAAKVSGAKARYLARKSAATR